MIAAPSKRTAANRAQAARSRLLEDAILASQMGVVCIAKIPNGIRYIGGEKLELPGGRSRFIPRTVPVKSPCDFLGCFCKSGRAIAFDAKMCSLVRGFSVGHQDHLPPHQRQFLQHMGRSGAEAGLIVEATAVGKRLWLDWRYLTARTGTPWPTIPWTDPAWFELGASPGLISFAAMAASRWVEDEPAKADALLFQDGSMG